MHVDVPFWEMLHGETSPVSAHIGDGGDCRFGEHIRSGIEETKMLSAGVLSTSLLFSEGDVLLDCGN